jgi:RES domain-containing protein
VNLPPDWNGPDAPLEPTQAVGGDWILSGSPAVLSVPSAIISEDRNYVLNVAHADFRHIEFLPSKPFQFDPRLKPIV